MNSVDNHKGFTLIELAIVLVIVGILAGSFLSTLSSRIETTRQSDTREELKIIKQALYGYAMSQAPERLPCPDCNNAACLSAGNTANDGLEDVDGAGVCDAATQPGNLPWVDLGLGRGDAWNSHYSYWVPAVYSAPGGFTLTTSSAGLARIDDTVAAGANVIAQNIAAVIFSHGKDTYGAINIDGVAQPAIPAAAAYNDQRENLDIDAAPPMLFIDRTISDEGAANIYDDILVWISEFELKAKMVEAGVLP